MRTVCIGMWGSEQGLDLITKLSHLFTAVVWENSLLALLCPPHNHTADREDLQKLQDAIGPNPVISE